MRRSTLSLGRQSPGVRFTRIRRLAQIVEFGMVPNYLRRKEIRRTLSQDYITDAREDGTAPGEYARWLIKNGGLRMRRALLKARDRYNRAKPARIRAAKLHADYRRKHRR